MAWSFGDGFDLYATFADAINGYWDSGTVQCVLGSSGRFGGRTWQPSSVNNAATLVKSSGSNDAVHHIAVAINTGNAITGAALPAGLTLSDGTTAQCSIVFRQDGALLLVAGLPNSGTTLATYSGAVIASNTWYAFEFEVVINSVTGRFRVRKNGNTVDDFDSGATLNTRASANNYANKLSVMTATSAAGSNFNFDDLFWRSDTSSVAWLGDIRCYTRMPASDQSVTFSRAPTSATAGDLSTGFNGGPAANIIWWYGVQAPSYTGTVTALTANFGAAVTGHVNMAIYDATGPAVAVSTAGVPSGTSGPGTLLASCTPITNPGTGAQTFTPTSSPTVVEGAYYWIAMIADASLASAIVGVASRTAPSLSFTYSSGAFPASAAGWAQTTTHNGFSYLGLTMSVTANYSVVNEAQQDATTSYVYDSTPGDADFYGIASISATPATVIATTVRGYMQKSDAGTRTAAVQVKSGATTVASPTLTLTTSGWQWAWRMDLTDPATGAAWTPAAVNTVQIGPKVIA